MKRLILVTLFLLGGCALHPKTVPPVIGHLRQGWIYYPQPDGSYAVVINRDELLDDAHQELCRVPCSTGYVGKMYVLRPLSKEKK